MFEHALNPEAIKEVRPIDDSDAVFKIRALTFGEWMTTVQPTLNRVQRTGNRDTLSDCFGPVIALGLTGWDNWTNETGEDVPFPEAPGEIERYMCPAIGTVLAMEIIGISGLGDDLKKVPESAS